MGTLFRRVTGKGRDRLLVSEYAMPDDFHCIWQKTIKTLICSTKERGDAGNERVEKLFICQKKLEVGM